MLLADWQRGKIPYFVKPPNWQEIDEKEMKEEPITAEKDIAEEVVGLADSIMVTPKENEADVIVTEK